MSPEILTDHVGAPKAMASVHVHVCTSVRERSSLSLS